MSTKTPRQDATATNQPGPETPQEQPQPIDVSDSVGGEAKEALKVAVGEGEKQMPDTKQGQRFVEGRDAESAAAVRAKIQANNSSNSTRLLLVTGLTATYMIAEIIGGIVSGSLALLSDAGHMASDVLALVVSLLAVRYTMNASSESHTYGGHRASVLAALINAATLVALVVIVVWEAVSRLITGDVHVEGEVVIWVGLGGLLVNIIGLVILGGHGHGHSHDEHSHEHGEADGSNMNVRGAYLHVMGDMLGSVAAVVSGFLALLPGDLDRWADPLTSMLISALIARSAWSLLKEATTVLMERAPANVDLKVLREELETVRGVDSVHHLHVWSVTPELTAITAHVTVAEMMSPRGDTADLMGDLRAVARRSGIEHCTFEIGCKSPSACICVMQNPDQDEAPPQPDSPDPTPALEAAAPAAT